MRRLLADVDSWLCIVLAAVTVLYLAAWPHDFFQADEGTFLYEAKRVLDGDIIYRDFFEVIAPVSVYAMALLYWLFGVSIETARFAMAIVHGLIAVMVFALCRRLGVRRGLALAAGLAHVALCYPGMTIATSHWVATLLILVVLERLLADQRARTTRSAAVVGIVTGLLIGVQHQKGVVVGLGAALALVLDALLVDPRPGVPATLRRLAAFIAAALAIVNAVFVPFLLAAGPRAMANALIVHPMTYYRAYNQTTWGAYGWFMMWQGPRIVEFVNGLPAIIPLTFLRAVVGASRRTARQRSRPLQPLAIIAGAALASVWYFPDYIHLSLVAPVCLVLLAETAEAALDALPAVRGLRPVIQVAALALCGVLLVQASRNLAARRQWYPYSHETAFGRIDYRAKEEVTFLDGVRQQLQAAHTRDLFCYTSCAGIYLTADAHNPTPYQLMIPGYNSPAQLDEVSHILRAQDVPFVVAIRVAIKQRDAYDPIWSQLRAEYEPVKLLDPPQYTFGFFRRRVPAPNAEPAAALRSPDR